MNRSERLPKMPVAASALINLKKFPVPNFAMVNVRQVIDPKTSFAANKLYK